MCVGRIGPGRAFCWGMATTVSVPELATAPKAAKVSLSSILLICLLAALAAVGGSAGVLLYLSRHGKLGSASAPVVIEQVKQPKEAVSQRTKNVVLEPMLVNLADADGHSYLRLGVVLAEAVDEKAKEDKPAPGADAAVRDSVLGVLGRKHAAELLQQDGKDALKREVKAALDSQVPEAKVRSVYFTEFLVQR